MKYGYETTILICILTMICAVAHTIYVYHTKPRLEVVAQNSGVCGHCGEATIVVIKERRGR